MGIFNRRNQDDEPEITEADAPEETDATTQDDASPSARETQSGAAARVFDTALGAGSVVEGALSSDGNVRLDGKFKGSLDIRENVLVGISAEIEANIEATNVSVAGIVRGDVSGKKVHLLATARIWGDIRAESLITEDGAFIEGRVSIGTNEAEDEISEADLADPYDDEGEPL
ncbi:MAG: polymer-forming cytoskeletal protein [Chloroflexota bacterium]